MTNQGEIGADAGAGAGADPAPARRRRRRGSARPRRSATTPQTRVSPAELRARGVAELGRASSTSVLYVLTSDRLYLFHAENLPDRALDAYAVAQAVLRIEGGVSSAQIARDLGVDAATLQRALLAAGYERVGASEDERRRHDRTARPMGNRRGRLVSTGSPVQTPGST